MPVNLRHEHLGINPNIMSTSAAHAPTCPTDGDTTVPTTGAQRHMEAQHGDARTVDKKSPEYLVKSMIAGGIAGCAVCTMRTLQDAQASYGATS
jgi:hypothetical protein